jgi:hypothetical protein
MLKILENFLSIQIKVMLQHLHFSNFFGADVLHTNKKQLGITDNFNNYDTILHQKYNGLKSIFNKQKSSKIYCFF